MCNVSRLRLQEEEQVAILLCLLIVRKATFLDVGGVVQMAGNFMLL
jgi:hypothetical protein